MVRDVPDLSIGHIFLSVIYVNFNFKFYREKKIYKMVLQRNLVRSMIVAERLFEKRKQEVQREKERVKHMEYGTNFSPSGRNRKEKNRIALVCAAVCIFAVLGLVLGMQIWGNSGKTSSVSADVQSRQSSEYTRPNPVSSREEVSEVSAVVPQYSGVIVLDAGHGGEDPGCVVGEVYEKNISMELVALLQKELEARGFSVVLTREKDEYVELSRRAEIANQAQADLFVSLHCNSFAEDPSVSGFECYYYKSEEGNALAQNIMDAAEAASIEVRSVQMGNYQVLRETNMTAVLVEMGVMTCPEELSSLLDAEYRETLVKAMADGLCAYIDA